MTTVADIKQQTAELLKLVEVGQGIPAEYSAAIDDAYNEVYAELQNDDLAAWDSAGPLPDEVTLFVVGLMAKQKMSTVGTSQATKGEILAITGLDGSTALWGIRRAIVEDWEDLEPTLDYL